jgi:5'-nucleotidase
VTRSVTEYVLGNKLPAGIDIINVNFPAEIKEDTNIVLAPAAKTRFSEQVDEREDPMGQKYYWIYGEPKDPVPGTDVYEVFVRRNIAITPLSLNINADVFEPVQHGYLTEMVTQARQKLGQQRKKQV